MKSVLIYIKSERNSLGKMGGSKKRMFWRELIKSRVAFELFLLKIRFFGVMGSILI